MKKYVWIVLFGIMLFIPKKGVAQIDAAMDVIDLLSGAMSEMDVFVNMDKNLDKLYKLQDNIEKMKKPVDYAKKAKYVYEIASTSEKVVCGLKEYKDIYNQFLGSTWTDWEGNNESCLTGLDHHFFVDKTMAVYTSISNTVEFIDDNTWTAAELEQLNAKHRIEMQKIIEELNEKIAELRPKVNFETNMQEYLTKTVALPQDIDLGRYDVMRGQGTAEYVDEFSDSGFETILNILKMVLAIALLPVIQGALKQNYGPAIGWGSAFLVAMLAEQLLT